MSMPYNKYIIIATEAVGTAGFTPLYASCSGQPSGACSASHLNKEISSYTHSLVVAFNNVDSSCCFCALQLTANHQLLTPNWLSWIMLHQPNCCWHFPAQGSVVPCLAEVMICYLSHISGNLAATLC